MFIFIATSATSCTISITNNMKYLFVCVLLATFACATSGSVTKEKDCKCWEDFKPERAEDRSYYCKSEKNSRSFSCNEEKPPICQCEKQGKTIVLDLGYTDCLIVDLKNGRWCKNRREFEEYFSRHAEYAIYNSVF